MLSACPDPPRPAMAGMDLACHFLTSRGRRWMMWSVAKEPDFFSSQVSNARRFWLDLRPRSCPGLIVASGGWELCARSYRLARPGFPWLAVELVVAGEGELELAGARHRLTAGAVFAYGPGIAHRIAGDPRLPLRKYFLDLAGDDAPRLLAAAGLPPGGVRHLPLPVRTRAILDLLIESGSAGGPQAAAICAALAEAALRTIAAGAVDPGRTREPAYATYARCRAWLEEHGDGLASLGEAAAACGVSSAWLCRLFRRYDRAPPWQLVRRARLQRAADLLVGGDRRIAELARELGYADPFHFSRAFSRAYGIAPQRFRALAR